MSFSAALRGIAAALGLGVSLILTGCGAGGVSGTGSSTGSGSGAGAGTSTGSGSGAGSGTSTGANGGSTTTTFALTGLVHSGPKGIVGSMVDLYVAGTSGYGAGAVSLLSGPVTTDGNGKFSIASDFTCPSANAQVYVVAQGGDAGGGSNSSTMLMSALGNCGDLGSSSVVDVSEVSSVASVYALAQFMKPGSTAVGTSSGNISGLVNAFATATNLIDPSTGSARATTPAGNGTVPQSTINTLANIMAACVTTKGDGACTQLFAQATPAGGTAPSDTLSALVDIALNPGHNVAALYALQSSAQTFQPALAGAPSDWTLSIEYTGGGLNSPQLLAVDGVGNIWAPNSGNYPGTLSEFSPTGEPLSGANGFSGGGLNEPFAVAVDTAGNIWSANYGGGVSKHTSGGTPLSGALGYTAAGLVNPVAIALDAAGNVFTANLQNSTVTKLNAAGTAIAQFTTGGIDWPYGVAIDGSQNVWVANSGSSNSVSKFSNTGTSPANFTGNMSTPEGIAIDANGNAWMANFKHASVSTLSSTGKLLSGAGYATPADVSSLAVDGSNTIWTANADGSISHLSATGASLSPTATGYVSADATAEVGIALDASGNAWTTDNFVDSIFEYIGIASPTVTPLQLAVKNKTIGQRP